VALDLHSGSEDAIDIMTRRRIQFITLFVLLAVATSGSVAAEPTAVTRISLTARSDGEGYVLRIHTSEQVKAHSAVRTLSNGDFELTLFGSSLAGSFNSTTLPDPVTHTRVVAKGDDLVVKFGLAGSFDVSVYRDRSSTDILVGLKRNEGVRSVTPVALVPKGPTESARKRWMLDTIVIDAGHGGKDPGTGAFGLKEKDITLAIAKKLGGYLESELGVKVVYTRPDDRFVDLHKRGKIANESGGKLFVSIHVNAQARGRNASGTETYFVGLHKSAAAREVMDRENAVINLEANPDRYKDYTDEGNIRLALAQSAYMHQSEMLASRIEKQFKERVDRNSRGVKQAGFIVLWTAAMPAVLVETGFISNRAESRFLASEGGQTLIASGIYRAIRDFKLEYEKDLNLADTSSR
jgi:N-acetylmuramoyl-L-alanine amidase